MAIERVTDMMTAARRGGYAIGYFESWNLESLQGVLDAAEQTRSPIIIGFNGEFMSRDCRIAVERLEIYGAAGRAAAMAASVPCGFIFNECADDKWVLRAATSGFNLVMPADPQAPYADYTRRVRNIVEQAHMINVAVEAELGELPCGASGGPANGGAMTDPQQAAEFVASTGVDLLAVSVGNMHIKLRGEQRLDLDQLARIRERVSIPLVLHGGTGIAADSLRVAIALGVAKVNYGTYLKQRYLVAIRKALAQSNQGNENPHELLGMGGQQDVMVAGRLAVRDAVLERIDLLGCRGRAG